MLPLLQTIHDQQVHDLNDIIEDLSGQFRLSHPDRAEMLPSGKQRTFDNRVGWARTYLKKAGLLETPGVGKVKITSKGLELLRTHPSRIDRKFLMRFPTFVEFQKVQRKDMEPEDAKLDWAMDASDQTPTELLEASYRGLRAALSEDLLDRVKNCSPKFFESLVLDLLVAM